MDAQNPIRTVESQKALHSRPEIVEAFSDYKPPFDVETVVERMVDSVPPAYLRGLKKIVLTNLAGLSRKRRRSVTKSRKRKVRIVEARGLYHPEWLGTGAWIEIFVDNTLKRWDRGFWLKIPLMRESEIGDVLFHEIGHHIHFTSRPEYSEKEDVADVWKVRLERNYLRLRFPWLRAIFQLLTTLFRSFFIRQHNKTARGLLEKGAISHAEYKEEMRRFASKDSGLVK